MLVALAEPAAVAAEAAALLRRAWAPPSLHYTEGYLRWQLSFPGPLRPLAVAAREAGRLIGFGGATPRRLRTREQFEWLYVVSFVAVDPEQRGRGVAAAVYAALLDAVREAGCPFLAFAERDSAGERVLRRATGTAAFAAARLAECPGYSFLPRGADDRPVTKTRALAVGSVPDDGVLYNAPGAETLAHYAADPRPRVFLRADRGSGLSASASAVRAEVVTARGTEAATILDLLFLPGQDPDALRRLSAAAAREWPDASGNPSVVSVPNVTPLTREGARAAGLRQVSAGFRGSLGSADSRHPFLQARGTTVEVI